jgi:hypothetical protein
MGKNAGVNMQNPSLDRHYKDEADHEQAIDQHIKALSQEDPSCSKLSFSTGTMAGYAHKLSEPLPGAERMEAIFGPATEQGTDPIRGPFLLWRFTWSDQNPYLSGGEYLFQMRAYFEKSLVRSVLTRIVVVRTQVRSERVPAVGANGIPTFKSEDTPFDSTETIDRFCEFWESKSGPRKGDQ